MQSVTEAGGLLGCIHFHDGYRGIIAGGCGCGRKQASKLTGAVVMVDQEGKATEVAVSARLTSERRTGVQIKRRLDEHLSSGFKGVAHVDWYSLAVNLSSMCRQP